MRTITPLALAILLAPMAAHADKTDPYLAEAQRPDARVVLAPPPAPGSPSYTADMLIFQETRALEGTERWVMATDDAPISIASLMALFACALDRDIDADRLPRLATIIARLAIDGDAVLDDAKAHFRRPRPFQSARGSVCQAREDLLHSYDYPSGHATFGWLVGLLMTELAPDRATAVLARARAYGESRIVCGAHNASSVDAGVMTGSAIFAALHASPAFRADLDAARGELAAFLAATPAKRTACPRAPSAPLQR